MCTSYIWSLALFSSLYRIKHTCWHTCLDKEVVHTIRCRNTICRLRQHQVASLPHKLWQTPLCTAYLGFICFYFYCHFLTHILAAEWQWIQRHHNLSLTPPFPATESLEHLLTFPGERENPLLPSAHLDLPLGSWASGRHGHAGDRLCFSVST